jgi:hypothetical protein
MPPRTLPAPVLPAHVASLLVLPWEDPVIDQVGYDPRAAYVERFWLGILGPSAVWLLRLLVDRLDAAPAGYELDLGECASALGLGRRGTAGAFPRTVTRCCRFGAARFPPACPSDFGAACPSGTVTLEVRRRIPPLSRRQVARLPPALQADHARWVDEPPTLGPDDLRERARQLALSLVVLGEDAAGTERQLQRWRFPPPLATEATTWALTRHKSHQGGCPPQ